MKQRLLLSKPKLKRKLPKERQNLTQIALLQAAQTPNPAAQALPQAIKTLGLIALLPTALAKMKLIQLPQRTSRKPKRSLKRRK